MVPPRPTTRTRPNRSGRVADQGPVVRREAELNAERTKRKKAVVDPVKKTRAVKDKKKKKGKKSANVNASANAIAKEKSKENVTGKENENVSVSVKGKDRGRK